MTPAEAAAEWQGWNKATAAIVALIRDRSAAYYGRGSEALAAAIEAGEHEAYEVTG